MEIEPCFDAAPEDWLIASSQGVWRGRPGGAWEPFGVFGYGANCVRRGAKGIVSGGDGGLWLAVPGADRWRQLHDERLTMVQDVTAMPGEAGWLVATAYGVHSAAPAEHGAWRWTDHREGGPDPSACFTLRLLGPEAGDRGWFAASEAGLWRSDDTGHTWAGTALADIPVRALARGVDGPWAGADDGSLWRGVGGAWERDEGPGPAIFAVHETPDRRLLAATTRGLHVRAADVGAWSACGPPVAAVCVAAAAHDPDLWALGACPGGLWWTADAGRRWHHESRIRAAVLDLEAP